MALSSSSKKRCAGDGFVQSSSGEPSMTQLRLFPPDKRPVCVPRSSCSASHPTLLGNKKIRQPTLANAFASQQDSFKPCSTKKLMNGKDKSCVHCSDYKGKENIDPRSAIDDVVEGSCWCSRQISKVDMTGRRITNDSAGIKPNSGRVSRGSGNKSTTSKSSPFYRGPTLEFPENPLAASDSEMMDGGSRRRTRVKPKSVQDQLEFVSLKDRVANNDTFGTASFEQGELAHIPTGKGDDPSFLEAEHPEPSSLASEAPEPDTLASEPPKCDTLATEPPEPDTLPSEPPEPDTLESESKEPSTLTSEAPEPDTLLSEAPEPNTLSSESAQSAHYVLRSRGADSTSLLNRDRNDRETGPLFLDSLSSDNDDELSVYHRLVPTKEQERVPIVLAPDSDEEGEAVYRDFVPVRTQKAPIILAPDSDEERDDEAFPHDSSGSCSVMENDDRVDDSGFVDMEPYQLAASKKDCETTGTYTMTRTDSALLMPPPELPRKGFSSSPPTESTRPYPTRILVEDTQIDTLNPNAVPVKSPERLLALETQFSDGGSEMLVDDQTYSEDSCQSSPLEGIAKNCRSLALEPVKRCRVLVEETQKESQNPIEDVREPFKILALETQLQVYTSNAQVKNEGLLQSLQAEPSSKTIPMRKMGWQTLSSAWEGQRQELYTPLPPRQTRLQEFSFTVEDSQCMEEVSLEEQAISKISEAMLAERLRRRSDGDSTRHYQKDVGVSADQNLDSEATVPSSQPCVDGLSTPL